MSASTYSSRDRVRAALLRQPTDRAPFSWGFGPTGEMSAVLRQTLAAEGLAWDKLVVATNDVVTLSPRYTGPPLPAGRDLWGIGRQTMGYEGGQYSELAVLPLAGCTTPEQVDAHAWPNPDDWADDTFAAEIDAWQERHGPKAVRVTGGNPFEIYCWMTGLEESMMNLFTCPEVVVRGLEHVTDYFAARVARIAAAAGDRVDLWFYADDLGGQQGLLMSPVTYRTIIQPFHRRLLDQAKQLTPHAFRLFHSDGSVFDLLPDLLEAGIDVLEAVQTECAKMEPERLAASFGDRLGFHGGISVQQWLRLESPAGVRREVRRLIDTLGQGGGYVAAPSHAVQVGTPVANVMAMLAEALGPDDYARAVEAARS